MHTLTAQKRDSKTTLSALRQGGSIPAVVYGPKQEATSFVLPLTVFEKTLKEAGESSVIQLSGIAAEPLQVLIHEVDLDPITSVPRHADFYAIEKGAKVEVAVQLVFVGESPAVKGGANLIKVMHEVEIEAEPANLPHEITVDISVLAAIGDQIHASDLKLPPGVELKVSPDEVVALTQEVKEEVVEVAAPADLSAIEVEKKGKEEEEGAAAPAADAKKEEKK